MSSPFAPFANATLTFNVTGAAMTTDRLGNVKPTIAQVVVTAMLKQAKPPNTEPLPGKNVDSIYYEGFIVAPLPLPASVHPDCECTATIDKLTGKFYLLYTQENPFTAALNIHTVDRIKGWFVPDSYRRSES